MEIFVIILSVIVISVVIAGAMWFVFYRRRSTQGRKTNKGMVTAERLRFRWKYIALPVAIFLLSIILTAYFYRLLPVEVAYHFELDGTPDGWLSRGMTVVWILAPQFFLTLLAGATVWGITKVSIFSKQTGSTGINPERILPFMGNMLAVPQLVIFFAMLDIFSYNSYQIHIMPIWVLMLIILVLATIALLVLLVFIFKRARQQYISHPKN